MLPGTLPNHPVYQDIARLRPSPILVNLWFSVDRAPFEDPFIGLVAGPAALDVQPLADRGARSAARS